MQGEGVFRLPTAAEWEWACRAGARTQYCFGDAEGDLAEYSWYGANSGGTAHPVGGKRPNVWGIYDCHGNVWEWCADQYDEYRGWKTAKNPSLAKASAGLVLRGGAWHKNAWHCRSVTCHNCRPGCRGGGERGVFGLRLALAPPGQP